MAKRIISLLVVLFMMVGFTAPVAEACYHRHLPPPPSPYCRRVPRLRPRRHHHHHHDHTGAVVAGIIIGAIIASR